MSSDGLVTSSFAQENFHGTRHSSRNLQSTRICELSSLRMRLPTLLLARCWSVHSKKHRSSKMKSFDRCDARPSCDKNLNRITKNFSAVFIQNILDRAHVVWSIHLFTKTCVEQVVLPNFVEAHASPCKPMQADLLSFIIVLLFSARCLCRTFIFCSEQSWR